MLKVQIFKEMNGGLRTHKVTDERRLPSKVGKKDQQPAVGVKQP